MNSNIPIPKWEMPKEAALLLQMKVGDSIEAKGGLLVSKFYEIAKALGMVITCRQDDFKEYRIWRLL